MAVLEYAGAEWHIARSTIAAARAAQIRKPIIQGESEVYGKAKNVSSSSDWGKWHTICAIGIVLVIATALVGLYYVWQLNEQGKRDELIQKREACTQIEDPIAATQCVVTAGG